ncbi:hypothetical protein PVNG_06046 [Plasmodium vivax North Korean]|uniref:Variable surface protein n=1 Tax=Plasmodium vivax North Korean TaxID=1035514 RepID=A0A0J9WF08_PLAVI|nr:hypothetical protein PVNG_06046 [Plasmodium vivax North Korean]
MEKFDTENAGFLPSFCSSVKKEITQHENTEYDKFCPKIMGYLTDVKANYEDHLIDKGCIYLYYWLYYVYFKNQQTSDEAFNLYIFLLDKYSQLNEEICKKYQKKIKEDILKKLKDLDDMNENLNSIINNNAPNDNFCKCAKECAETYMKHKITCTDYKEINFCNELENIRKQYNSLANKIANCDAEKWLPSFNGNNPIVTVIYPLAAILLMSFTLFILYKVNNSFS